MFLRNLFEARSTEVAIIFGRFNPPHKGHKAAWELASKSPVWFVGTNESTVGPKDPLPFDVKVEAMKTVWPEVESHIVAETSWLTLASKVYEQYPDATLLCLTDEEWVTKTIVQYNGKEGAHGFYNFKNITQKPTPRLSSATALRDAVSKGDREAFTQAAGVSADTPVAGKPFFDLVAEYLMPYQNAPKKVVKKKVPAPVEGVAEGAPIVVMPRADRLKKADPPKQRYMGDIVPPTKPPSTEKRGVKGRPGQRPMPDQGVAENFADGKNPQDKGDSKRHGINTKASVSSLRKTAKQGGRKGQLAHWLANMKAGRAKKEDVVEASGKRCPQCGSTNCSCDPSKCKCKPVAGWVPGKGFQKAVAEAEAKYDANYQDTVKRVGQMAKEGPRKTVWDPVKRVYKTVPVNPQKKTEDAAGVGIITKQNSTPDVNKGTPRKNLKAFKLVK